MMMKLPTVVVLVLEISAVGVSHPRLTLVVQLHRIHPTLPFRPHFQSPLLVQVNLPLHSLTLHTRLNNLLRKSPSVPPHRLSNSILR